MRIGSAFRFWLKPAVIGAAFLIGACSPAADDPQHDASGMAIKAPAPDASFADYVTSTRQQLETALQQTRFAHEEHPFGEYTLDQVVDMRAPFALGPDQTACARTGNDLAHGKGVGFLFVHGLTDSPYWLSDVRNRLRDQFPCGVFHGVLLPGHGTVPGDLLDIDHQAWLDTVRYGMETFGNDIDHIIPIGYSTGATLIGRSFKTGKRDPRLSALIMLSPGLAAKSDKAWLTPYVRHVQKWVNREDNSDPGKYGSMAMNAAAEFHLLTAPYRDQTIGEFDLPTYLVVSSDDQTIDPMAAVDFFCNAVTAPNRGLLWYQGEDKSLDEYPACKKIDIVSSAAPDYRVLNHAHTAITMRPENPVYGLDGKMRDCGHYDDPEDRTTCQTGTDKFYGEINLAESATPGTLRRGTFNPNFYAMMDKIIYFIEVSLDVKPLSPNE